ncbi:hypothetical protein AAHB49_28705, partial [Bacillus cereus]
LYFVQFGGWCLTSIPFVVVCVFRIYRETLSRFSCAASLCIHTIHFLFTYQIHYKLMLNVI